MDNYKGSDLYKRRMREDLIMLSVAVIFVVLLVIGMIISDWVYVAVGWLVGGAAAAVAVGAIITTMKDRG